MATPKWIKQMLDKRGVHYEEVHHPRAFTAQEVAHYEHTSGHRVAKVVVVIADGRAVELVLPASRRVQMDQVKEVLGANNVRMATEKEMEEMFDDCEVGAVPPLSHWKNVEVVMDKSMEVDGEILFQAGTHEDAIRLQFDDWRAVANPKVASFTVPSDLSMAGAV